MNPERPDTPENPDEGPGPDATEELRAAEDDATGDDADGTAAAGEAEADESAEAEESAATGEPDEAKAGERDEVVAEAGAGAGAVDEGADAGEVVAVGGAGRPRRRRSRVAVASVAAAVLLVGGGGALLASTSSGGSGGGGGSAAPGGDGTPPPLALDGWTDGGSNGIAPGEPDPGGVTYRADGELPDGPGSAPVYRVEGRVTAAEVTRLAKALGVEGTPTAEGDAWQVGAAGDGSGPMLRVTRQAPGAWTFNRYTPGGDNCQKVDVCASGTAEGGDPVSEAAARKAAAPVLKAVGQDDAKLDAGQLMGAVRVVNADPEVGGLPTHGWTTGVQIGADGQVVGGSGNLKSPVKGDTYPVVDAERALELLNSPGQGVGTGRGGIGGCTGPVPLEGENGIGPAGESATAGAEETPCERMTALPKPEPVTVEKAVFGLASHQVDGRPALVPSWMFEVRPTGAGDTYTVTRPAVDPEYLASPEPRSEPTGKPRVPGDTPSTGPDSRDVEVQGYSVDGDELTVTFWGGVCGDYSASVSEGPGEVTVTVTDTPWEGKVCIMIAKAMERTVRLDEPLGDRKVVGSDGEVIPKGGITELEPR
ncbi:hypothetical protein [Streptomyces griseiscabiei]|uniref:Large membrane protein n=1 Tax=Streptomyces griseiscabiei TaxID=2993540 RepID=A0ABU4KWI7_9ACTN|nr:hypothetical protein [Streptomyces griseiscabiei]MBZ3903219.1 hypothetical protein [Streptomyces griseiscabiei]MDX2907530.1 hypothetical protein [Streptomyces griseiscabiei]